MALEKGTPLSTTRIYLIGLPGSGKSTLGKELAAKLNILFVDLDAEIEKETGKKIAAIFKDHGEFFFRQRESEHLRKWASSTEAFVMATGGGTPAYFDNMELINGSGKSIFLDVPASEIVRRIRSTELSERPLLDHRHQDELKDQIELMRSRRINFYRQAHTVLLGEGITLEKITEQLNF